MKFLKSVFTAFGLCEAPIGDRRQLAFSKAERAYEDAEEQLLWAQHTLEHSKAVLKLVKGRKAEWEIARS